jgi:hypothetical protein
VVLSVPFLVILVVERVENLTYRATYTFMSCLMPALITGAWCYFDKKSSWSWGRIFLTVIGIIAAMMVMRSGGRIQQ